MVDIYQAFNDVNDKVRMLCIDATYTGLYLIKQGHTEAGRKLILTAINAGGVKISVDQLCSDIEKSLSALAAHAELRDLK